MSSSKRNPEKQAKNEYIPHFIAKKPFYLDHDTEGDYLEHQRLQNKKDLDLANQKWYDRGKRAGPAATKFRKGACENCGAMTHKAKDCLSRPRKKGARWTGQDIQADEIIQEVELGWDGKRDRWNGYDSHEHKKVVEEHMRMEELRRESERKSAEDVEMEGGGDEDKYAEESEMPGQTYDAASRISTRNLRIREDTAKYLLNLDLDSAKYDPKTRTMVDRGATQDQAAALVEEDNFMRSSGDAAEFERLQRAAWESRERGNKTKMHLQANPTEAEHIKKKEQQAAEEKRARERKALLERYGGEQHLVDKPPVLEEEERYIEYTASGQVKGREKTTAKSKYTEDKLINNHTTVWGSWWQSFKWGFACCHSTVKNSYCTGEEGIRAAEEANKLRLGLIEPVAPRWVEQKQEEQEEVAEEDSVKDKSKGKDGEDHVDRGKRKLKEMRDGVTEEDMEQYRKQQKLYSDPMANFVDTV
ncbi:unnamed protein product [Tuber melanosporum]|uniref:Pre-mRNA-splicing factor SLU7 n=1 Tax=Tuber melanosporum (strain Mel28) TaxID=656061 RepID=D5G5V1_TUBMM|nr:uncharacterized protein GSTUM_00001588001 [Tuber melanosporum]CAZ79894.1 unnamed protein product [Tuber melanosporum]